MVPTSSKVEPSTSMLLTVPVKPLMPVTRLFLITSAPLAVTALPLPTTMTLFQLIVPLAVVALSCTTVLAGAGSTTTVSGGLSTVAMVTASFEKKPRITTWCVPAATPFALNGNRSMGASLPLWSNEIVFGTVMRPVKVSACGVPSTSTWNCGQPAGVAPPEHCATRGAL